eukprot:2851283-Prymnesium_polylepis.1
MIQPKEPGHALQQVLIRLDHNTLLSTLDWTDSDSDSREADAEAVDGARVDRGCAQARSSTKETRTRAAPA